MKLALVLCIVFATGSIVHAEFADSNDEFQRLQDSNQEGKIQAVINEQNRVRAENFRLNKAMTADIDALAQLQEQLQDKPGGWLSGIGQLIYVAEGKQHAATRPELSDEEINARSKVARAEIHRLLVDIRARWAASQVAN